MYLFKPRRVPFLHLGRQWIEILIPMGDNLYGPSLYLLSCLINFSFPSCPSKALRFAVVYTCSGASILSTTERIHVRCNVPGSRLNNKQLVLHLERVVVVQNGVNLINKTWVTEKGSERGDLINKPWVTEKARRKHFVVVTVQDDITPGGQEVTIFIISAHQNFTLSQLHCQIVVFYYTLSDFYPVSAVHEYNLTVSTPLPPPTFALKNIISKVQVTNRW